MVLPPVAPPVSYWDPSNCQFPLVGPLQHIINLSERTFTCATFFSVTAMVSASFFPFTLKSPQTSISILMLMIWAPLWVNVGEFASTVTTRLSLRFCLPRAPKFPVWWTLYGWSLFKHLVLILHLLLSMSPGLIMSLLSILFPDTCHCSAFLHQTHCHLPAVRSLNFWPKFNHASCLLLLPSVLLPLLVALTHPRSTIYAILPFQQPYFLWEPLFTCRGVHLKPFCHPPLQPTRFLMAPSKFMAAVKILHIRFNCLQDLPSMSFLFKTLHDIKSSFGISKRSHLPITVSILHQIHLVLQPSWCVDTDSSMLWAAFTVAFLCSLHSSELTCGGTFDAQIGSFLLPWPVTTWLLRNCYKKV